MTAGRILVLGAGFLGATVTRRAVAEGRPVTIVTRSEPEAERAAMVDGAEIVIGDAGRTEIIAAHLQDVEEIVYCVGSSSPVESEVSPADDVAMVVPPLVRLLELLRMHLSIRLIYLSSGGTVYGNAEKQPIGEDVLPRPVNSYGIIKWTCEQYVMMYAAVYGVQGHILRIGNVYGPGQPAARGQGVVAYMFDHLQRNEPMPLFGADEAVRDYIYVEDVADAVVALLGLATFPAAVNVASGHGYTLNDVARAIESVTGRPLRVLHAPQRSFDVRSVVLDVTALRGLTNFDPRPLELGLRSTWLALRAAAARP